jgi:RNA polymerase sigma-70 factor, ECF subfamily
VVEREVDGVDDDHLMARVGQRDQAAFGNLVARHLASVHRYLTRMTIAHADADDLAQETFLRLWLHAGTYRPGTVRLTTWLHRIAHNLAVDELRKHRPAALEGVDPELDIPADGALTAGPGADPQAHLASEQMQHRLDQALRALPPNQRAALLLCQVQGFSNRDAADVLGVSVRSLESLVARARRSLRARLQHLQIDVTERQQSNPT